MIKCSFEGGFEFNHVHGFYGLHSMDTTLFYKDEGETIEGTKYWLFIDTPETIGRRKGEVELAKEKGVKIISLFYDVSRFPFVDGLVAENLIDMFILFDKKYQDRFPVPTYISDFYLLENVFPPFNKERNGKQCYFGHKLFGRVIPAECEHIKGRSLVDVYNAVSTYSNGYVTSEGKGENEGVVYQNKAKYIEMLFCGLQVQCQNGIETLNYEKYKDKEITEDDLKDIYAINLDVKSNIIKEIINL